jgi:hypothetical protein
MAVEPISLQRYRDFVERGPVAFQPITPLKDSVEFARAADAIDDIPDGKITPTDLPQSPGTASFSDQAEVR